MKDEAKTLLTKLAAAKEADGEGDGDTTRHDLEMDISSNEETAEHGTSSVLLEEEGSAT